ncbi:MAG: DUF3320 domain-containing protein [Pseudomonadota bacterium]
MTKTTPQNFHSDKLRGSLLRYLKDARLRLLDTGTRNRLINVNLENKRQKAIRIVNEGSTEVFNILWRQSKPMRFLPLLKEEDDPETNDTPTLVAFEASEDADEARKNDQFLEVRLTDDRLQKKLLSLFGDAKHVEEEQGINVLFLALGFLKWFEDKTSDKARYAPLLLLPVDIKRDQKTGRFSLRARDDELTVNMPLKRRLKDDYGIELPDFPATTEDFEPDTYFQQVSEATADETRWIIEKNSIQLGLFSFAKLLMYRDLDPENWPDGELTNNPLIGGLLTDGFEACSHSFDDVEDLDKVLEPAEIIQVVDADASQTKVIEVARRGANLVVQGPPGTGKSQTITNILAAAVHDGKKVLFIAEKMAALNVVHERMEKCALGHLCLELHSRKANKKLVLEALGRTLKAGGAVPELSDNSENLRLLRDELNAYANALNEPLPNLGFSPFQALSDLVVLQGKGVAPPSVEIPHLEKLSADKANDLQATLSQYLQSIISDGRFQGRVFYGVHNLSLQPMDLQRLALKCKDASTCSKKVGNLKTQLSSMLEVETDHTFLASRQIIKAARLASKLIDFDADNLEPWLRGRMEDRAFDALECSATWAKQAQLATPVFLDAAFDAEVRTLREDIAIGLNSWWSRLSGRYRKSSSRLGGYLKLDLPKHPEDRISLIDKLLSVQKCRKAMDEERPYLKEYLGPQWRGDKTDFAAIAEAGIAVKTIWEAAVAPSPKALLSVASGQVDLTVTADALEKELHEAKNKVRAVFEQLEADIPETTGGSDLESCSLDHLVSILERYETQTDSYESYAKCKRLRDKLAAAHLGPLLALIDKGDLQSPNAADQLRYLLAESRWNLARTLRTDLDTLRDISRDDLVAAFQTEESSKIEATQRKVLSQHLGQVPRGSVGEMGVVTDELGKKRRHKPIRRLLKEAGSVIQRIKPVFLMSPISVAQYLGPGGLEFDLLVIDEASQVRPEDALGALARSKQLVVVGDQKQLPPTSFFDRVSSDEDEDDEQDEDATNRVASTDFESILSLCVARGIPERMLEWHYRSRDPSLIRVSNAEFYGDGLVLAPSPLEKDADYGLRFRKVAGVYSGSGGKGIRPRTNKIEAQALVAAVKTHATASPDLSLGIATFSQAQKSMVTELLEFERRSDQVLDRFLRDDAQEYVFVKNIENIQGDERDVIFISVCYGPSEPNGRLRSMNFGPINRDGGERRLNVLFSRARIRCDVFASFDPGDIDLNKTQKTGPRVLKRFLEFAKSGFIEEHTPTGADADSPFEADVAQEIEAMGYLVDLQVGSAGFKIDIGVRHPEKPGQYVLAVECDGATYHSALWARERDRLRQGVLEGLGWSFHRIWSTDWFYDRATQIEKLRKALEAARQRVATGIAVKGALSGVNLANDSTEDDNEIEREAYVFEAPEAIKADAPYERAHFKVSSSFEPHEVPLAQLAGILHHMVEIEGPIHEEEAGRRLAALFGKGRAGARIMEAAKKGLLAAKRNPDSNLVSLHGFWATQEQFDHPKVRDRSKEIGTVVKADMLPPSEITSAAAKITEQSGEVELEEMVQAISRMMGFQRAGPDFKDRVISVLKNRAKTDDDT